MPPVHIFLASLAKKHPFTPSSCFQSTPDVSKDLSPRWRFHTVVRYLLLGSCAASNLQEWRGRPGLSGFTGTRQYGSAANLMDDCLKMAPRVRNGSSAAPSFQSPSTSGKLRLASRSLPAFYTYCESLVLLQFAFFFSRWTSEPELVLHHRCCTIWFNWSIYFQYEDKEKKQNKTYEHKKKM